VNYAYLGIATLRKQPHHAANKSSRKKTPHKQLTKKRTFVALGRSVAKQFAMGEGVVKLCSRVQQPHTCPIRAQDHKTEIGDQTQI
jgi:hypothetical protein